MNFVAGEVIIATAALLGWEEGAAGKQADNAGLSCQGSSCPQILMAGKEPGGHGSHDYLE